MSPTLVHGLKRLALFAVIAVVAGAPQVFQSLQPFAHVFAVVAAALGATINPQVKS